MLNLKQEEWESDCSTIISSMKALILFLIGTYGGTLRVNTIQHLITMTNGELGHILDLTPTLTLILVITNFMITLSTMKLTLLSTILAFMSSMMIFGMGLECLP